MNKIDLHQEGHIGFVTLNHPSVHNALDPDIIEGFKFSIQQLDSNDDIRIIIIKANGKHFCAGANINWMKRIGNLSYNENYHDALSLANLFHIIFHLKTPTIASVNGCAIGGGAGLAACCDIIVADEQATFSFSEVKLGITPATISPFVTAKISPNQAKRFFITGEKINAQLAQSLGLVNEVVPAQELASSTRHIANMIANNAPGAVQSAKKLAHSYIQLPNDLAATTASLIAQQRMSPEGQEGLCAFLDKRTPNWTQEDDS